MSFFYIKDWGVSSISNFTEQDRKSACKIPVNLEKNVGKLLVPCMVG